MKNKILLSCIIGLLAACSPFSSSHYGSLPSTQTQTWQWKMDAEHLRHVNQIRTEANRLAVQVGHGEITKVQAAQLLNQFRISTVGHNTIDDSVYETYLKSAVNSQAGFITTEQSKQQIKDALQTWHTAWRTMGNNRPTDPAFTNFLMVVMGMPMLR